MMIHLCGTGSEYHPTERGPLGIPIAIRTLTGFPKMTFCGIVVPEDLAQKGRTVLPLDHPDACAVCLEGRKASRWQYVMPVAFERTAKVLSAGGSR